MSTPYERTHAIFAAGPLLRKLLLRESGEAISEDDRWEILHVLRHYPDEVELKLLASDVERHCPRTMLCRIVDVT